MVENEKKDVQIKDDGLILINWEKGTVDDVFDLILINKCTITFSSEKAFCEFLLAMRMQLFKVKALCDYLDAFTFVVKEFTIQIELMNKNKMEE